MTGLSASGDVLYVATATTLRSFGTANVTSEQVLSEDLVDAVGTWTSPDFVYVTAAGANDGRALLRFPLGGGAPHTLDEADHIDALPWSFDAGSGWIGWIRNNGRSRFAREAQAPDGAVNAASAKSLAIDDAGFALIDVGGYVVRELESGESTDRSFFPAVLGVSWQGTGYFGTRLQEDMYRISTASDASLEWHNVANCPTDGNRSFRVARVGSRWLLADARHGPGRWTLMIVDLQDALPTCVPFTELYPEAAETPLWVVLPNGAVVARPGGRLDYLPFEGAP